MARKTISGVPSGLLWTKKRQAHYLASVHKPAAKPAVDPRTGDVVEVQGVKLLPAAERVKAPISEAKRLRQEANALLQQSGYFNPDPKKRRKKRKPGR